MFTEPAWLHRTVNIVRGFRWLNSTCFPLNTDDDDDDDDDDVIKRLNKNLGPLPLQKMVKYCIRQT